MRALLAALATTAAVLVLWLLAYWAVFFAASMALYGSVTLIGSVP